MLFNAEFELTNLAIKSVENRSAVRMLLNLLPTLDDNLLGLLRVVYALLLVFLFLALFLHGCFTLTNVWAIPISRRME